jgi:hypothetical protein
MLYSATAQSSTAIEVSWDLTSVDPGFELLSLSITQTNPSGNPTTQNFSELLLASSTVFNALSPDTTYTYVIDATWSDGEDGIGATYNPEPGINCTTKSAGQNAPPPPPPPPDVPILPDKPTKLTASWNAPDYTVINVSFELGADTTSFQVTYSGTGSNGVSASSPWTSYTVPGTYTSSLRAKPNAYNITVVAANGSSHQSITSAMVYLAPPPGPGAINDLTAAWNDGYTGVVVEWKQASGTTTTGFELQRYAGQFSASTIAQETIQIQGSPFTDTPAQISSSSKYQYRLIASNIFGQSSALSNSLSPPVAPPSPTSVVAKWGVDYTRVTVSWDPSDHADNYEVILFEVDIDDVWTQKEDHVNVASTNFTEPLVGQVSIWHIYQVIAHNRFGSNNTLSNSLTVPPPPTPPPPQEGPQPDGPPHVFAPPRAP